MQNLLVRPFIRRVCTHLSIVNTSPRHLCSAPPGSNTIRVSNNDWNIIIGLEVHAQINSKTKLFSSAPTDYFSPPNTNVSFFDASFPGTLPTLNRYCVEAAIKLGLALHCKIAEECTFDRKHYYYPDLPSGYQITQKRNPIATDGRIDFIVCSEHSRNTYEKSVKVKQIQLEQDSGKILRDHVNNSNLVDLNRCGVGLLEIVFEPTCFSTLEAVLMARELVKILKRLDICSCKMEESALRIDTNISVSKVSDKNDTNTRVEIKNLNSFLSMRRALSYEINRQISLRLSGENVQQETRMFDVVNYATIPMRSKEDSEDYRFMPEPNLPPLRLSNSSAPQGTSHSTISIEAIRQTLPRLPEEERTELMRKYEVDTLNAFLIVNEDLYDFFVEIASLSNLRPADLADHVANDYAAAINYSGFDRNQLCKVRPDYFVRAVELVDSKVIDRGAFFEMLKIWLCGGKASPDVLMERHNWKMISDEAEIRKYCIKAIENNPQLAYNAKMGRPYYVTKLAKAVQAEASGALHWRVALPVLESILENTLKSYLRNLRKSNKKKYMCDLEKVIEQDLIINLGVKKDDDDDSVKVDIEASKSDNEKGKTDERGLLKEDSGSQEIKGGSDSKSS